MEVMPLDSDRESPELLCLREAGEWASEGPSPFSSHCPGGGVQPSPAKAEQAQGSWSARENRDQQSSPSLARHQVNKKLYVVFPVKSAWRVWFFFFYIFILGDYFNKVTGVLPHSYLCFPPATAALQGSAHTSFLLLISLLLELSQARAQ